MPTAEELAAEAEANGRSIEELADDPNFDDGAEVYIEGTTGQLSLTVGGRSPDSSELKLRTLAVKVSGQYKKGETMEFRIIARVDAVKMQDVHDDYGTVTACKRIHFATPISAERVKSAV